MRSTMYNQRCEREDFARGLLEAVEAAVTGFDSVDRGMAANQAGVEIAVEAAALFGEANGVPNVACAR